jgi:EAL domain-containing protein (putative c-di-GMP-specific phosphodiesterase class I)
MSGKLSRAHTVELRDDEASRFFVASLVRLGAPLDIRLIAQGVEDAAVLPILGERGTRRISALPRRAGVLWRE